VQKCILADSMLSSVLVLWDRFGVSWAIYRERQYRTRY